MQENACIIRNKELKDSITAMSITNSPDSSDHLLHGELIAENCISVCDKSSRRAAGFAKEPKRDGKFDVSLDDILITPRLRLFQR